MLNFNGSGVVMTLALLGGTIATPAIAGDVNCLWRGLSPATQDDWIAVKSASPTQSLPKLSQAEIRSAFVGCVRQRSEVMAAAKALELHAVELAEISKTADVVYPKVVNVEVVWRELPPESRASIRTWMKSPSSKAVSAQTLPFYRILLQPLGVPNNDDMSALTMPQYSNAMIYFLARAQRENLEAEF